MCGAHPLIPAHRRRLCLPICLREVEGAADIVIRGQKALTFFVVTDNKQTEERSVIVLRQSELPVRSDEQTPVSLRGCWQTQPNDHNAGVWTKRLEGMIRLEKLAIGTDWFRSYFPISDLANPLKSLINAVIMRNASTLITIDMECNSLPFDHKSKHPVLVYDKLQDLICEYLTPAAAAACPRLVRH